MSALTERGQLELFELGASPKRPRHSSLGFWQARIRHDQAMIGAIAALIGLTVVFALGVERGKELVRAERTLWQRAGVDGSGAELPATSTPPASAAAPTVTPSKGAPDGRSTGSTPAAPQPAAPKQKMMTTKSRYAVQAATYSRMQLARLEMQRLHQTGERAFLVQRQGRTVLYVGPFPSETLAREKLPQLKGRYGDCFIKSL